MNQDRKAVVLKAGIIPETIVSEFSRWGVDMPEGIVPAKTTTDREKRRVLEDIQEVIESEDLVAVRMTDMDALQYYKEHEKSGRLYYVSPTGTTFINISYARTPFGHYLIPWTEGDLFEVMLDEGTYLKPNNESRVYFADVQELYYGEKKAFMVCIPTEPTKAPRSET